MQQNLHYGPNEQLSFDVPERALVAALGTNGTHPVVDLRQEIAAAFAAPIDFPPIEQAIVPGDRITVSLPPGIARGCEITVEVVRQLIRCGHEEQEITLLRRADDEASLSLREQLTAAGLSGVELVDFHPDVHDECVYLAALKDDSPVYLARPLVEADFVLPILPAQPPGAWEELSLAAGVYPAFTEAEAAKRFRGITLMPPKQAKRLRGVCAEVWWLAGLQCCIGVANAANGPLRVVAGTLAAVDAALHESMLACCAPRVPNRAGLVIAGISNSSADNWCEVTQALWGALRVVEDGGTIVLCTKLAKRPVKGVARLLQADDPVEAAEHALRAGHPEAETAWHLANAIRSHHVALFSELPPNLVEDLGMIPVTSPADIERLISRHPGCIVLNHAQSLLPSVAAEETSSA